jgi:transcriptional regulator with GAF, ATPase, and Fis domain
VAVIRRAITSRVVAVLGGDASGAHALAHAGAALPRLSKSLLARAESSGGTACVDDASAFRADQGHSAAMSGVGPALVSALGPPARGFVYLDRAIGEAPFAPQDAAFVTVLAHLLGAALAAAERQSALDAERRELRRDIDRRGGYGDLIGASAPMQRLALALDKVAPTEATVLVTGETGSGKELVARELHRRSARRDGPFFALNCAALPEALIESELFGHKRGAFSGAERDRRGVFELAERGTLFLDEIGELPLSAQAKVLRALDAREVLPLGGGMPIPIDVRLVAATHRDLQREVQERRFRQDLLFRLKVFPVHVPPLRERLEDLRLLVAHFFARNAEARHKRLGAPSRATLDALAEHGFPGNVRELAHLVDQACIMAEPGEVLDVSHFSDEIFARPAPLPRTAAAPAAAVGPIAYPAPASLKEMAGAAEREILVRELAKDGWNKTRAAKRLEVSLRALMDKVKKYDIQEH